MMGNGLIIKHLDLELFIKKMDLNMKVVGIMINRLDSEWNNGTMDLFMKVNFLRESNRDMESLHLKVKNNL